MKVPLQGGISRGLQGTGRVGARVGPSGDGQHVQEHFVDFNLHAVLSSRQRRLTEVTRIEWNQYSGIVRFSALLP
jgi:hypothetical protein